MTGKLPPIVDVYGRRVNYLRLSVTDRCNLRCRYCWSCKNMRFIPHGDILRYEEMLDLIDLARRLDIGKVRLTGGEPFVRRDFTGFIGRIFERCPSIDLRITTNATLLGGKIGRLRELGVRRLNISLDTLQRDKFQQITGRDFLHNVWTAIEEALTHDMKIKINAVAMKGVNDDELPDFLRFASEYPLDLRFIEFMPMGADGLWERSSYWSAADILEDAKKLVELERIPVSQERSGPARMYRIKDGKGRLGIISPLSNHFCGTCNRLRVTANGYLRTCLFSDREFRLTPLLRHSRLGVEAALKVMRLATENKPIGHELLKERCGNDPVAVKRMSAIGG